MVHALDWDLWQLVTAWLRYLAEDLLQLHAGADAGSPAVRLKGKAPYCMHRRLLALSQVTIGTPKPLLRTLQETPLKVWIAIQRTAGLCPEGFYSSYLPCKPHPLPQVAADESRLHTQTVKM